MRTLIALMLVAVSCDAHSDAKAGERKAQLCLLCHKPGNVMASAPTLEGQPAKYLVAATTAYKTGKRPDPVMQTNVANLSAQDIRDIADYFASKSPVTGAYTVDQAKVAAGENLVKGVGCATCHQATFHGAELVPRLAGQSPQYLISQLEAFAAGRRTHPAAQMPTSGAEIESIASYFTTLK